jgi:hypothetical protein
MKSTWETVEVILTVAAIMNNRITHIENEGSNDLKAGSAKIRAVRESWMASAKILTALKETKTVLLSTQIKFK